MKYKSIRAIMATLLLVTTIMFMGNCGRGMTITADPFTEVENEFQAGIDAILAAGGVADLGIGRSVRRDIAKRKARENGSMNLGLIFEQKVQNLTKSFIEELGEDTDVEINEAFSSASKTVMSQTLRGASPTKTKYVQEKVDGTTTYSCYMIMAIQPGLVNQSLMDELKNKNKKTYERFRASEAHKEMDAAMKDYEAQQASE